MARNSYAKKQPHNGGKTAFSHGTRPTPKKAGKIAGQMEPALPPQKASKGTGIAGRNSHG